MTQHVNLDDQNVNPKIPEAELIRHKGKLLGDIRVGDVFAWEPDLPHARELCVVTELTGKEHIKQMTVEHGRGVAFLAAERGEGVRTRPVGGGEECWNDISRFREACVRTRFKPMSL